MCEPASITMAVIAVAGAVAASKAQQDQADYTNSMNEVQHQNILQANATNQNNVNVSEQQTREAAIQKKTENDLIARGEMAKSTTAAGENGVSGLSVGYLLDNLAGKRDRYDSSVDTNYGYSISALENQRANMSTNASSQINALRDAPMPNYVGTGLQIAQTGMKYYSAGTTRSSQAAAGMPMTPLT